MQNYLPPMLKCVYLLALSFRLLNVVQSVAEESWHLCRWSWYRVTSFIIVEADLFYVLSDEALENLFYARSLCLYRVPTSQELLAQNAPARRSALGLETTPGWRCRYLSLYTLYCTVSSCSPLVGLGCRVSWRESSNCTTLLWSRATWLLLVSCLGLSCLALLLQLSRLEKLKEVRVLLLIIL